MVERFRVRGYKSLVDLTLHPAPVNLIVGASCCGKTNLLEALALLGAAVSGDMRRGPYGRGLRTEGPHASALRCLAGEPIEIEGASGGVVYRVHLEEGRGLRYRSEVVEVDGFAIAARGQESCWATFGGRTTYLDMGPRDGMLPALCWLDIGARIARFLHTVEPIRIAERQLPDVIDVEALARATAEVAGLVPSVGAGIRVEAFAFFGRLLLRDRFLREGWSLPESMGHGALWLLALFLLLVTPDAPAIVALDGADVALSPEVAAAAGRRICDLAVRGERQLFWVTTRASALAMFGDEPRARVLQLGRDWRGATVVEEEASHVP